MSYDSPLDTMAVGNRTDADVPVCVTTYNKRGKLIGMEEVCSCQLAAFDPHSLPRKGYVAVLEVPLHSH